MAVMTAKEIVDKCVNIANNYKTLYIYGCFGAPMNSTNKKRYTNNYDYNKQPARKNKILNASSDTFGFDCVNLIKGILWGWRGDVNWTYGGASYGSNGVPDTSANGMFENHCYNRTSNFSNIVAGEFVWMDGHIGVYIGNGLAVECTPIWKDGVQITAVGNIGKKAGYNTRNWSQHGRCRFIEYNIEPTADFLPSRGYYQVGDSGANIELLDNFLAHQTTGEYFGTYTYYAVKAFQHAYGLEEDGNIGPITIGRMRDAGLNRYVGLPSRGYYKVGDSGNNIKIIDDFLASHIRGDYYGNFTKHAVMALQTVGKNDGVYHDDIDGYFGPLTLRAAEYYGFKH